MAAPGHVSANALLRRSALLPLRHPVILLLAIAAIAAGSFLALYVAGHCFPSVTGACVSPPVYNFIGQGSLAVQYEVAMAGGRLACKIALTVALWCLFIRAESNRPPVSARRILRFVARMIVYWIVFQAPDWLLDLLNVFMAMIVGEPLLSVGMTCIAIALYSYLHARLVLYVVSGVYDDPPKSFRESWNAALDLQGPLFRAFLALEILSVFVVFGFWYLAERVPGAPLLSAQIANWAGVAWEVAHRTIITEWGNLLSSAFMALMAGAMAVITHQAIVSRNVRLANIFE
ncbi:hypothetical protein [Dongia sedimenti]|uniref:ABC transporter permease n=1 Tax=Dongia sedimenti TaxID=3064282 RepID=A0ABU0YNJ0_9PROT|nr:hypothetical protein [Rhodospirillaceae bacterium R-7]